MHMVDQARTSRCWRSRSLGVALGTAFFAWSLSSAALAQQPQQTAVPQQAVSNVQSPSSVRPPLPNRVERGAAVVAARARRVPRADGGLRQCRLRRRSRRLLLAEPIPVQRDGHAEPDAVVPGAGAGRARREQDRSARPARRSRAPSISGWRLPTSARRTSPCRVRVGRQELVFGEQRLVGHVSWLNAARTFDGAKRHACAARSVSGRCVRRLGRADPRQRVRQERQRQPLLRRVRDDRARWCRRARSSRTCSVRARPESPHRDRRDRQSARDDRWARAGSGSCPPRLDYGIEMAVQTRFARHRRGRRVGRPLAAARVASGSVAGRVDGRIQLRVGRRRSRPTARAARSISSIPTPHDKYGLADQVGWRTSITCAPASSSRRSKGWPVTTNYHSWWLAEARDGALQRRRRAARARRGRRGEHATSARRSTFRCRARSRRSCSCRGGYAHIFPGAFLKQATPGASYSVPVRHGDLRVPGGQVDVHEQNSNRENDLDDAHFSRHGRHRRPALLLAGLPAGLGRRRLRRRLARKRRRSGSASSRSPTARRSSWRTSWASSRSSASTRRLEGSVVGGHPRQAVARREPGDAHAASACRSPRRWGWPDRR